MDSLLNGDIKHVKMILERDPDFDKCSNDLFIKSAVGGYLEVVKMLLKMKTFDSFIYNMTFFRSLNGHIDVAECMVKNGGIDEKSYDIVLEVVRNLAALKFVIKNGANIHYHNNAALEKSLVNEDDETILYLLSLYSDKELKIMLMDKKLQDKMLKYVLKRDLSNYMRIINIFRELGIDIFDLLEKES